MVSLMIHFLESYFDLQFAINQNLALVDLRKGVDSIIALNHSFLIPISYLVHYHPQSPKGKLDQDPPFPVQIYSAIHTFCKRHTARNFKWATLNNVGCTHFIYLLLNCTMQFMETIVEKPGSCDVSHELGIRTWSAKIYLISFVFCL